MRRSIILLFVLFILLVFFGCQPTPDEEIIVNKGDGALESIIAGTTASQQAIVTEGNGNENNDSSGKITYLNTWTETYEIPGLTCNIEADVIVPETSEFPVYKVQRREFDLDSVIKIVNYFTKDATGVRETSDTKEELEEQLIQAKKGTYVWDDNGGRWEAYEGQKEDIADLEGQITNAQPEVFDPVTDNAITIPMNKTYTMPGGERIYVKTTTERVYIYPIKYGGIQPESWIVPGEAYPGEPAGTTLDNVKISEEDAKDEVTELLSNLGIEDMGIAKTEKARILKDFSFETVSEGWQVTLSRNNGGCIPVYIDSSEIYGTLYYPPEEYIDRWNTERIIVYVDENDIQSFIWQYPLEVVEELNSNVPLLPFDEIKGKVREYIKYAFTKITEGKQVSDRQITISEVVLTNVLLPIKDESEYHMLVPAWIVYYEFEDGLGTHTAVLAINAIDGSSIDLALRASRQE
jgi:hypothetical protein